MILEVFSVYDKVVQAFLPPFYARTKAEAIRQFSEAVNDEKHQFAKHAADYSLMFLGEFDDASGFLSTADPLRLISAFECVSEDPFTPDKEVRPRAVM